MNDIRTTWYDISVRYELIRSSIFNTASLTALLQLCQAWAFQDVLLSCCLFCVKAPKDDEDTDSDDVSWRIQSGCISGMVFTWGRETEHHWRAQESKPKKKKKGKEAHGEHGEYAEKGAGKGFQKGPA